MGSDLLNFYNLANFFVFAIILRLKHHIIRTMARKTRIEFPGVFYHILARGNNKQVIFKDDQDYNEVLKDPNEKDTEFFDYCSYRSR